MEFRNDCDVYRDRSVRASWKVPAFCCNDWGCLLYTSTVTTAWVAYELALRLIGDQRAAARVYTSALVHDVGKIGIPLSILEKPGKLDDEEMKVMRTHVELTEDILEGCIEPVLLQAAARHHEKLDGSDVYKRQA